MKTENGSGDHCSILLCLGQTSTVMGYVYEWGGCMMDYSAVSQEGNSTFQVGGEGTKNETTESGTG